MVEIGQSEGQQGDLRNAGMGSQEIPGLGELLRGEREKKGLSQGQLAQITKLRKHFLEALENEDWNHLPSSVFVKGFIRSYAKALGMDERKLIDLYEITAPVESAPSTTIEMPQKTKKRLIFVLLVLLGAIAVTINLWKGKPSPEPASTGVKEESLLESREGPKEDIQLLAQKNGESETVQDPGLSSEPPSPNAGLEGPQEPMPLKPEKEEAETPADAALSVVPSTEPASTAIDWLVLRGTVKARTWMKIHVDDQEPREYVFKPGSVPQWKAKKGFNILVGNAAGIAFSFNGKEIGNLGKFGQVVRLRLPEDFKVEISED